MNPAGERATAARHGAGILGRVREGRGEKNSDFFWQKHPLTSVFMDFHPFPPLSTLIGGSGVRGKTRAARTC